LQVGLPEELRTQIAKKLFKKYVSIEEAAFAEELYVSKEQLKTMQSCGMYIGSHGYSHYWLNSVDYNTQRDEISKSIDFLKEVGSPVDDFWVMCYPYGAWNEATLKALKEFECAAGLTTQAKVANTRLDQPLLLPRLDTNDIQFT